MSKTDVTFVASVALDFEERMSATVSPRAAAMLRSPSGAGYEQVARDPRAYPMSPARIAGAAKPIIQVTDAMAVPVSVSGMERVLFAERVPVSEVEREGLVVTAEAVTLHPVTVVPVAERPVQEMSVAGAYLEPIEPAEPLAEPRQRGGMRRPAPMRSRLSPSQRTAILQADAEKKRDEHFVSVS